MRVIALLAMLFTRLLPASESYSYFREVTLSASTDRLTVQQPTTVIRTANFVGASIYCSVACTITMDRSGGIATSTAAIPTKVNPPAAAPTIVVFTASNGSAGTTINKYVLSAGQTLPIDLSAISLDVTNSNLSFTTSSITGDVKIFLMWREQ